LKRSIFIKTLIQFKCMSDCFPASPTGMGQHACLYWSNKYLFGSTPPKKKRKGGICVHFQQWNSFITILHDQKVIYLPVHECLYYVALPPAFIKPWLLFQKEKKGQIKRKGIGLTTYENKETINRKPSPISVWEERMLRVVVLDSTHTQGSSRYFLRNQTQTFQE